jgi:acyl transferase domain-containing protein
MNDSNGSRSAPEERPYLFVASAQSSEALLDLVTAYRTMLARPAPGLRLRDLCYSASARHRDGNERLGVVARSLEDLAAQLDSVAAGEASTTVARGQAHARARGKLAFVFSGQGSQWLGMACQLFAHEPVFRAALERCDEEVRALLSWSVIEQLFATPAASRLDDIDVVQPAIFAFQVALAALWRSWGIAPDVVVGHSVGELAAAHVAGALSLPDAARIVCARSRVSTHPCARGAMAVIGLPAGEVEALIAPSRDRVWVSIHESPESTVISGDSQTVESIVAEVLAREVFGRRVKAPVAGHCAMWDPLREPLLDLIATIRPRAASVRLQSTVDLELDARADDGAAMGPAYWWPNLRQPVLFAQAMRKLLADGVDTFLEISPHPILCHAMSQCAKHADAPTAALASTRRNEDERTLLLSSLAALYVQDREIDWPAVCDGTPPAVTLPDIPWQRERFRSASASAEEIARSAARSDHPMLGRHIELQGAGGHHVWESSLDPHTLPMLAEHRVAGTAVLPAAAYLEMALAAARAIFREPWPVQEDVVFEQALVLPADSSRSIQLSASEVGDGAVLRFHARRDGGTDAGAEWSRLAVVRAVRTGTADPIARVSPESLTAIRGRCQEVVPPARHYQQLEARAMVYGPSFQGVCELVRCDGEALGLITWPAPNAHERERFLLHPAILDACLQVSFAALPHGSGPAGIYAPVGVRRLRVFAESQVAFDAGPFHCHARLAPGPSPDGTLSAALLVFRTDGTVVAEIGELRLQPLEGPRSGRGSGAAFQGKLTADPIGQPGDPRDPSAGGGQQPVLAELLAAEAGERAPRLEALLAQYLARVLGRQAARIRPDVGLNQLGLDSLMALEFRNRIRADLDVAPPLARLVVSDVNLRVLAREILDQLATKTRGSPQIAEGARAAHPGTDLGTDDLTDDQIRELLREFDGDG